MPSVNVLVVEDNDFTRSTLVAALRAEGCVIVAAVRSARDAMREAERHAIDCAVLDLHLGTGPSGIDIAYALRRDDPDIGIVILTSFADPRLLSADQRPLPPRGVYLNKNDIRSTEQLREGIDEACGLGGRSSGRTASRVPLTDAQMELLHLVANGLTNAEIARRRVVSERAVETSLARIMRRLGIQPTTTENPRVLLTQAYFTLIGSSGAP